MVRELKTGTLKDTEAFGVAPAARAESTREPAIARLDTGSFLRSLAAENDSPDLEEFVGTLVAVGHGKITIEVRRRFEIPVDGVPDSLCRAVGKVVGVTIIDGKARWRLVDIPPEPGVVSEDEGAGKQDELLAFLKEDLKS